MTDYTDLAASWLGCEQIERRMHPWCEMHDEPWPCPRADEVADEVREVVAAELDAVRARARRAEDALDISHTAVKSLTDALIKILLREEARLDAVRALHVAADECDCYPGGFSPETYEGPSRWCPMHGEVCEGALRCPGNPYRTGAGQ